MDDLIADFVAECREMLEALGGEIVAWEAEPQDRARLPRRCCREGSDQANQDEQRAHGASMPSKARDGPALFEIIGLRERSNRNLAQSLSDYAHERWAAHRPVNPLLWICVSPFIDDNNFSDIQRVFQSDDHAEQEAAALVCYESKYEPARKLMEQKPQIKNSIESGKTTWTTVAERMKGEVEL